ncbi:uncharacterized protein [Coffea arabica]|uniref:DDE Tnp4 domain-containing protein n=1 Tax=Coffea arabica TaxID=13443 RepID=A0A6P6TBY3_COFAR|nr:uncharacterized protein LOC113699804 [Coffea arabica]
MRFIYVRIGWEDSAHDSRVLLDAISNPSVVFPVPLVGKHYVVDAEYRHMPGFMAPFKSNPKGRLQTEQKGLFNRHHSSVQNVIERTLGEMQPYNLYLTDAASNMDVGGTEGAEMLQFHVTSEALYDWKELRNAMADHMWMHRNEYMVACPNFHADYLIPT